MFRQFSIDSLNISKTWNKSKGQFVTVMYA